MIEINLLPEELRNRIIKPVKSATAGSGVKAGPRQLILIIPLVFAVLLIAHTVFIFLGIIQSVQLSSLKDRWGKLAPEKKALEDFNSEYTLLSGDSQEIQRLLNERIKWAEKLNKLSLALPPGVWFEAISASGKEFQLRGKVVSLSKEEVSLIRQLIDALKNDANFFKGFNTLELSAVEKGAIGGYEVSDFTLIGTLKGK
ncbi:MAG: hypothetical protein COT38_01425 [Candidatus Omnitrophica bacterium CG08_land_8_20_14_0_20_41_16]|uniref:Fimbrial assembly protein n=1 Tax=Candidatus Sherwoodlollariibacterium unditelluris TaxID=1974757 RepID=A0A2G9YJX9_9BACT|nr:MAG: hypothetical protein COX41_06120 [Candidatus Omnitrophica bacterium CG23_combo_of_CG06-09_8_20_14_all_41_10]PIS34210.1 MAG: hypothetical protein COT38_01425 [Candidatus Omnitrophica bacterium CG08_land_8_20_14_0_20_41_16]